MDYELEIETFDDCLEAITAATCFLEYEMTKDLSDCDMSYIRQATDVLSSVSSKAFAKSIKDRFPHLTTPVKESSDSGQGTV